MLTASCAASASTCEKSGLMVALRVIPGVMPQRPVRPASISPSSSKSCDESSRVPVKLPVIVGSSSMLRPGVMPAKPVSFDSLHR